MARIRTIKPEFWTSEQVVECSPNARLLFIGMLNFCDDSGIHPANVRRLQMEVFPCGTFGKDDVDGMIQELLVNGLIDQYDVDGDGYWIVTGFSKHQKLDQQTYKYPLRNGQVPENVRRRRVPDSPNCSANDLGMDGEHSSHVHPRKGKERKGKEFNNTPLTPNGGSLLAERFAKFYDAYPIKKSKGAAEKAFHKIKPDDDLLTTMIRAVKAQTQHRERLRATGQFVPEWKHPSTWLNQRCWEDELEPVQQSNQIRNSAGGSCNPSDSRPAHLKPFPLED